MTRRDRMLEAFDRLAVAEMDDVATFGRSETATAAPVARPVVPSQSQRSGRIGWSWVIGACAIGLVFLATRR